MSGPTDDVPGVPLRDPIRLSQPIPREPIVWPVLRTIGLSGIVLPPSASFADVILARRSARHLRRCSLRETANLLTFSMASKRRLGTDPDRSSRPSHSAGALHPVNVILLSGASRDRLFKYDPDSGSLHKLSVAAHAPLRHLHLKLADIVPNARCDALVLLTDMSLIASCYRFPESLAWRDAGALMQTMHLCAVAYRLGFCPVGISGSEALAALDLVDGRLVAMGAAVIGRPASDS